MKSTMKSYDFAEWLATGTKPVPVPGDLVRALRRLLARLEAWHVRAQTRRELAWMSDDQLNDLGISRGDADFEANKPFWRA